MDRRGPGDPGDKLSVKIKLLTDRRPHLPEIQHIVMQIKQGGRGSAGRPTAAPGEPAGLAAGTPLRGPAGRRRLRVGAGLPGYTLRPARSARPRAPGRLPVLREAAGAQRLQAPPAPAASEGQEAAARERGGFPGPADSGVGGGRGQRGSPKPIALPPFARTGPEAQPARGFGRDRQAAEEDKDDMEGGGSQATRTGRLSNPSVRGGELRRGVPAEPPPRLPTAPPTMAVLLSWARQASTNADPFGGPGRGRCWVGGAGGARGASGVWGRVQCARCPKSRGLVPPRSPAQKAAAAGGRARLRRWRGGSGSGWAARWAEPPEARGGNGADGPRAMAYIGVGGCVLLPAALRGPRGGRDRGGRGAGCCSARALLLENVLQRPRQVLDDRVQDALVLLLRRVPAARRDGLLGPRQAALRVGLQGGLGLGLALLLLLDAVLRGGRRVSARAPTPPRPPGTVPEAARPPSGPGPALLRPRLPGARAVSALPHGAQTLRPMT